MTSALALDELYPESDGWSDGWSGEAAPPWHRATSDAPASDLSVSMPRPSVLDSGPVAPADLVRPIAALARRSVPALPVAPALRPVLPEGLRRGSTVSVTSSMSLLLALLGGPSSAGAWCALVGLPAISAEAAAENNIELARLALIPTPGPSWLTAVGALLDAVEVVALRPPPNVSDGDIRRLSARARTRGSILMPFLGGPAFGGPTLGGPTHWPRADVALDLEVTRWTGMGAGHGRLHARQVMVKVNGRGSAARPRSTTCWLPSVTGGIAVHEPHAGADLVPIRRAG